MEAASYKILCAVHMQDTACLSLPRLHPGLSFYASDCWGPRAGVTEVTQGSGCDHKGQQEGVLWGDGLALYPDYGGGYTDPYMC